MPLTVDDYLAQLRALLPPGAAWEDGEDSTRAGLLLALADEFARIDRRLADLLDEADVRTTLELLTDWEWVAGLPDPCSDLGDTVQERRAQLTAKITARGGQSRQFFIDLAEALGFAVTITEFTPFRCGISACGDALRDEDWMFAWQINAPETTIREFRTGQSATGEPLRTWGNAILECAMSRLKPAHSAVLFKYGA